MLALKHQVGEEIKERYVVREVLGAGAFGTVYRVEEALGARVVSLACKEMHVMDDVETRANERDEALRMFQEEAYLLSTLRDPHIPSAHFESERGVWLACPVCGLSFKGARTCPTHGNELSVIRERYYLVMDFLDGLDLEQVITANGNRPLDEAHVLEWTLQICSALEAVHANGFSHRDIKPANIKIQKGPSGLVSPASTSAPSASPAAAPAFTFADSGPDTSAGSAGSSGVASAIEGRAMLIDFGLVKPSANTGKFGTVAMNSKLALGTSGYAPTDAQELASPDARTDILALGMTMYRLLTGQDPSDPAGLEAMRKGKPRDFNPALSGMAEAIILKAAAPERNARYPDVRALKSDLLAARYPIEARCPHCSHLNRSLAAPGPDTRCERCGRPLLAPGASTSTSTSTWGGSGTSNAPPLRPPSRPPATPGSPPAWKKSVGHDPRAPRIDEIRGALTRLAQVGQASASGPVSAVAQPGDTPEMVALRARLGEIAGVLARASKFTPGTPDECPLCRSKSLKTVSGAGDASCPLCRKARLAARDNSIPACPVCREGNLPEYALGKGELFCSVCREVPLSVQERRKAFGLMADDRWACSYCQAGWDLRGNEARLEEVHADPYKVGEEFMGQSLPIAQWKALSARGDRWFSCDHCAAQFEARDLNGGVVGDGAGDALALMHVEADPFGVGAAFKGRVLGRGAWAQLARGREAEDASHDCPSCHAAWQLDASSGALALVRAGNVLPSWAAPLASRAMPVGSWYCLSEGKSSPYPGHVCQNLSCMGEWNDEGPSWRLVAALLPRFQGSIGQAMPPESWRRRAQGVPAPEEIGKIKREEAQVKGRLLQLEQAARGAAVAQAQGQAQALRGELAALLKASALEGHVRLQRMTPARSAADWKLHPGTFVVLPPQVVRNPLRPSEAMRWESRATLCDARFDPQRQSYVLAKREAGVLIATDERLQFVNLHDDQPTQVWECSLPLLERAFVVLVNPNARGQSQVVIVESRAPRGANTQGTAAVGFEVAPSTWNIKCDDELLEVTVEASDLAALLSRLKP